MSHRTRIMYVERKIDAIEGPARIGRVTFSKAGQSVYYRGRTFVTMSGRGFKSNYSDAETGDEYWISGCKKDGSDALYSKTVVIDEDVREEYWTQIRNQPERRGVGSFHCVGKYLR